MKKILLSSLLAVMAVTSANAKIASTNYVDEVAQTKADAAQAAAKTYTDQEIGALDSTAVATGTNDGKYATVVTQTDGKVSTARVQFDSSIGADSTALNAPTSLAVKTYVDEAVAGVNGNIGNDYQKLSDKLKSSDNTTQVDNTNKDTLYPTVGRTQMIADAAEAAAEAAANAYTDAEVAKKQDVIDDLSTIREGASKGATAVQNFNSLTNEAEATGTNDGKYVTSVTQTNGKITASVVAFDTSLAADSTNAPQSQVVKTYVDNAIDGVNGDITAITNAAVATEGEEEGQYVLTKKVVAGADPIYSWELIDRALAN